MMTRLYFRPRPAWGLSNDQNSSTPPVVNSSRRSLALRRAVTGVSTCSTSRHTSSMSLYDGENQPTG